MKKEISVKTRQSGVVLVVSLIILMLLTLISLSGMKATTLEGKMAGNARDRNLAFQAAESTLVEAEKFIKNNPATSAVYTNAYGLNFTGTEPTTYFDNNLWTASNSKSPPGNSPNHFGKKFDLPVAPSYIIYKIPPPAGSAAGETFFRITARAQGKNSGTQVILQEVYKKY